MRVEHWMKNEISFDVELMSEVLISCSRLFCYVKVYQFFSLMRYNYFVICEFSFFWVEYSEEPLSM